VRFDIEFNQIDFFDIHPLDKSVESSYFNFRRNNFDFRRENIFVDRTRINMFGRRVVNNRRAVLVRGGAAETMHVVIIEPNILFQFLENPRNRFKSVNFRFGIYRLGNQRINSRAGADIEDDINLPDKFNPQGDGFFSQPFSSPRQNTSFSSSKS